MEIRRATPEDHAGILELQAANYLGNLAAAQRRSGFLSAEFTPAQVAAMAEDLGIVVASEDDRIVGYLCLQRADQSPLPAVVETMVRCCRTASYRGTTLAQARLFVYGPVCIDRSHRGRGLLRGLYGAVRTGVAGRFEFGVTLVSQDNPHSLRAHVHGLGMVEAARFEHGGGSYHLLVFDCR